MSALDSVRLVCVSVLLFEVGFTASQIPQFFFRPGQTATVSCGCSPPPTCSEVVWFYRTQLETDGRFQGNGRSSRSDDRFSLTSDCSLVINNVSAVDAGQYIYRPDDRRIDQDTRSDLNILTVSESPPDTDGNITLRCSLVGPLSCPRNSVRWVNADASDPISQHNCVSDITVKRPSGNNRTYTCQVVYENRVQISAELTLVSVTENKGGNPNPGGFYWIWFIIVCVGLTGLSLTAWLLPWWMNSKRNTSQSSGTEMGMCVRVVEASAASADPHVVYENQQNT